MILSVPHPSGRPWPPTFIHRSGHLANSLAHLLTQVHELSWCATLTRCPGLRQSQWSYLDSWPAWEPPGQRSRGNFLIDLATNPCRRMCAWAVAYQTFTLRDMPNSPFSFLSFSCLSSYIAPPLPSPFLLSGSFTMLTHQRVIQPKNGNATPVHL